MLSLCLKYKAFCKYKGQTLRTQNTTVEDALQILYMTENLKIFTTQHIARGQWHLSAGTATAYNQVATLVNSALTWLIAQITA